MGFYEVGRDYTRGRGRGGGGTRGAQHREEVCKNRGRAQ